MRWFSFMVLISIVFSCFATEGEEIIKITVVPNQVYVEKGPSNQYLNFDFLLENLTDQRWRINTIQASVFDEKNKLILRKYVAHQGVSPSINTIPKIELEGKGSLFIFNPFYFFDAALKIEKLDYEFLFNSITDRRPYKSSVTVHPVYYETKTDLILPLKGRLFVMDGHDFYAHHRRVDLTHPAARELGIKSNRERYALDLCVMNEHGDLYKGKGEAQEDWFGFGAAVYSPGNGKVVELMDNRPDDKSARFAVEEVLKDRGSLLGNYVIIDHRNGEYSMIAHLKQGGFKVRVGDDVQQGQLIAHMGSSGIFGGYVHIHYELGNGTGVWNSEGLPSYFRSFRRVLGSKTIEVKRGQIDTGDIVETLNLQAKRKQ